MYFGQYLSHSILHTCLCAKTSLKKLLPYFEQQHSTRDHKINIYSHELIIKICRGDETEKNRKKEKTQKIINREQKKGR